MPDDDDENYLISYTVLSKEYKIVCDKEEIVNQIYLKCLVPPNTIQISKHRTQKKWRRLCGEEENANFETTGFVEGVTLSWFKSYSHLLNKFYFDGFSAKREYSIIELTNDSDLLFYPLDNSELINYLLPQFYLKWNCLERFGTNEHSVIILENNSVKAYSTLGCMQGMAEEKIFRKYNMLPNYEGDWLTIKVLDKKYSSPLILQKLIQNIIGREIFYECRDEGLIPFLEAHEYNKVGELNTPGRKKSYLYKQQSKSQEKRRTRTKIEAVKPTNIGESLKNTSGELDDVY